MKHFNYDQRLLIQRALTLGWSFSRIAGWTGKDRTSVSREIRSHISGEGKPARSKCRFRHECVFDDPSKCPAPSCNKKVCTISCSQCALFCDRFEPEICPKLLKPPYVCNGCKERGNGCHLSKRLYDAEYAHKMYKHTLSDSRSGISLTEDELQHIAETVIPLLKKGISLPVAYAAYADSMPVSERTLYDYIDKGVFDAGNLDLRSKVRRKPSRQKSGPVLHVDKKCHVGRTYADFLAFTDEHPELGISEMDTVEGRQGGKVILTIFFRNCKLQLMFLRDSKNAAAVSASYAWMREALGTDFSSVFQVILTDYAEKNTMPKNCWSFAA